jgi:hypothetical protein
MCYLLTRLPDCRRSHTARFSITKVCRRSSFQSQLGESFKYSRPLSSWLAQTFRTSAWPTFTQCSITLPSRPRMHVEGRRSIRHQAARNARSVEHDAEVSAQASVLAALGQANAAQRCGRALHERGRESFRPRDSLGLNHGKVIRSASRRSFESTRAVRSISREILTCSCCRVCIRRRVWTF